MATTAARMRLAVLDTDTGFLQVLRRRLEDLGWQLRVLASPVPIDAIASMRLHALVLDPAVIGPRSWAYLEALCAQLPQLAVVVCTGPSSVAQRIRGLRLGADDWVNKPCHPEELIARVEAVVRRRERLAGSDERQALTTGELEIKSRQFQGFVQGASVDLTRREFELLELLANAEGQVLERADIYERVWGYAMPRGDRSVDVYVRKLRQKLEHASPRWRYIHTHFGVGYGFAAERVTDAQDEEQSSPANVVGAD